MDSEHITTRVLSEMMNAMGTSIEAAEVARKFSGHTFTRTLELVAELISLRSPRASNDTEAHVIDSGGAVLNSLKQWRNRGWKHVTHGPGSVFGEWAVLGLRARRHHKQARMCHVRHEAVLPFPAAQLHVRPHRCASALAHQSASTSGLTDRQTAYTV
ncbi:MAG: hypothetical protein JHC40_20665 [Burkholderiales bacterium]|nr:hypothetical protein [Burkholderiales bacterium]